MKLLITGASGFIGGYLVEEALRRGYEVWAGVRAGSNRDGLSDERIHFIDLRYADLEALTTQLTELKASTGGWDYVIHNAGLTKTTDKRLFFRVNATYTQHLLEALHRAGHPVGKFILMSSLSSFGPGDEIGFSPIQLTDPQHPNTAYGRSKLEAEERVRKQPHFPYIILRPTGVYGPGEKDYFMAIKSIQSGLDFAVGATPQRITFIYVKDLATVAFLALEKKKSVNREYFVADGDVYTDSTFARLVQAQLEKRHVLHARIPLFVARIACLCSEGIGKLLNRSMTLNTDKYIILKQRNWICDTTPLHTELGFTPSYPLRKGLAECIAWYRTAGWL